VNEEKVELQVEDTHDESDDVLLEEAAQFYSTAQVYCLSHPKEFSPKMQREKGRGLRACHQVNAFRLFGITV
jgi:hypothetical protein